MVTDGIPGHGVDWTSAVGDSATDHRNYEVTLAALIALGLLVMTVTKLSHVEKKCLYWRVSDDFHIGKVEVELPDLEGRHPSTSTSTRPPK
eukprot:811935-Prymnesium_polylepis.1